MNTSYLQLFRLAAVCIGWMLFPASGNAVRFHVSPSGSDAADGSKAHPFATLERARDAVRAAKNQPATVWIAGGDYYFSRPFELTTEDSGADDRRVVYRAEEGQSPRLLGGRKLAASDFKPVTNPAALARISRGLRDKIVELDLKALGVQHTGPYADVFADAGGIADLYFNGRRMPLSRFPNQGYMTFKRVLYTAGGPQGNWRDPSNAQKVPPGSKGGIFEYRPEFQDRHALWSRQLAHGVWFKGYWRVTWENPALRVLAIDDTAHTVTFVRPIPNGIGNKYTRPQGNGREAYWAMNLLEEIDQPGEWAMDFVDQKIYFYPPEPLDRAEVLLLDRAEPVITLKGASHVTLRGLTVEANLGDGIRVTNGSDVLVAGCVVRYVDRYAVVFDGGRRNTLQSCDLYHLGEGGVWLSGGDDKSSPRVPAKHRVVNNHIHDFSELVRVYTPGVNCGFTGGGGGGHHAAVGMLVAHNLIHDTPHGGVLFGSMDSVFEYNEVFRFCMVSNDLGAFYSYDLINRQFGNITFRYNFMHSSAIGDGIYFDHDHPDMHLHGNIAYLKSDGKRGTGFLYKIGSQARYSQGIDCTNNISIQNTTGFEFVSVLPNRGRIENNVAIACKTPILWRQVKEGKTADAPDYSTGKNRVYDTDPGFVNAAGFDFRLKPDAQLLKDLPGFERIPVRNIGLYRDEYRRKLPDPAELDRAGKTHPPSPGLGFDILDRR